MNKNIVLVAIIAIPLTLAAGSCKNSKRKIEPENNCKVIISKALNYINQYYFKKENAFLDSSIQCLKSIENICPEYHNIIMNDEVHAYFLKKEYNTALKTLSSIADSILPFQQFKEILQYKIMAKEAESKGDYINQKKCFQNIIVRYNKYLEDNQVQFDSLMRLPNIDLIQNTQFDSVLAELYYYISKTENIERAINKLDSLQKRINGNQLYFEELKKTIKNEGVNKMDILLN